MAKVLISENGVLQNLITAKTKEIERLKVYQSRVDLFNYDNGVLQNSITANIKAVERLELYQKCIDIFDSGDFERDFKEVETIKFDDVFKTLHQHEEQRKVIYMTLFYYIKQGYMSVDQIFHNLTSEVKMMDMTYRLDIGKFADILEGVLKRYEKTNILKQV